MQCLIVQYSDILNIGLGGGVVRLDVNGEMKFLRTFKKKFGGGGGGVGSGGRVVGVRMDVNEESGLEICWGGGGSGVRVGGQGRCEQRSEVIVKIPKKNCGGGVRSGGGGGFGSGDQVGGGGGSGGQGGCE